MLWFFLDYLSKYVSKQEQPNTSLFDIISNNDFENSNCSSDDENRLQIGKIFNYTNFKLFYLKNNKVYIFHLIKEFINNYVFIIFNN